MVLSCVWCVVGIGARAHQEREGYILRPRKFVRMRVRVRIRVHVTGEVLARGHTCVGRLNEQPHWRWPKQGAAVAEQGGLGELSGLCKVYRPKRRPAEGAVLFRPIMWLYVFGLSCSRFYPAPCFGHIPTRYALLWPPSPPHNSNNEARERSEPFFPWFSKEKKPLHNGSYGDIVPKIKNKTLFCTMDVCVCDCVCDSTS